MRPWRKRSLSDLSAVGGPLPCLAIALAKAGTTPQIQHSTLTIQLIKANLLSKKNDEIAISNTFSHLQNHDKPV